jgi:hypothetical protein
MAIIIKPPDELRLTVEIPTVFLSGSIELGTAIDWQSQFEQELASSNVIILNPRRNEWDSSWKQSIDNAQFRGQVEWELEGQERADVIAMYFAPETKSPITLLELGLFSRSGKVIVCCPDGFWRKGNIDIVCNRYGIRTVEKLADLIDAVKKAIIN